MSQTIRVSHSKDYTVISNIAIRDKKLSFRARGLHHLLLSYPDGWKVKIEHLVSESDRDGKDAIASALKELEKAGYISRTQIRIQGKITGYESVIRELPAENPQQPTGRRGKKKKAGQGIEPQPGKPDMATPQPELPDTVKPELAKPHPAKPEPGNPSHNKYLNNEVSNYEVSIPPTPQGEDEREGASLSPEEIATPNIPASPDNKPESSQPTNKPTSGSSIAAGQVEAVTTSQKVDPFLSKRPTSNQLQWSWLPDGDWKVNDALDAEFWTWLARQWSTTYSCSIYKAKADVVSHFINHPEKIPFRWDEYQHEIQKPDRSPVLVAVEDTTPPTPEKKVIPMTAEQRQAFRQQLAAKIG